MCRSAGMGNSSEAEARAIAYPPLSSGDLGRHLGVDVVRLRSEVLHFEGRRSDVWTIGMARIASLENSSRFVQICHPAHTLASAAVCLADGGRPDLAAYRSRIA